MSTQVAHSSRQTRSSGNEQTKIIPRIIILFEGIQCPVSSEELIGCVVCPIQGRARLPHRWFLRDHQMVLEAIRRAERIDGSLEVLRFP